MHAGVRLLAALALAAIAGCATVDPREDTRIEAEVKARLVGEKRANLTRVGVLSSSGVVYLSGAVESEEPKVKEMAAGLDGIGIALGSPEIAVAFGDLMSIPTTFLFDRDGKTASVHHGAPEDLHERLGKEIAAALR